MGGDDVRERIRDMADDQTLRLQSREQMLTAEFNRLDQQLGQLQAASTTGAAVLSALAAQGGQSKSGK